mmetsp:Transcript_46418/g.86749  ORF Transcript_46418/g.86749 Transcript_46418/m.86749 type:complete len:85 (-) Transcript_46418:14-268(-)
MATRGAPGAPSARPPRPRPGLRFQSGATGRPIARCLVAQLLLSRKLSPLAIRRACNFTTTERGLQRIPGGTHEDVFTKHLPPFC